MRIDLLSLKDNNNNTEGDNGSEGRSVAMQAGENDKEALSVYL